LTELLCTLAGSIVQVHDDICGARDIKLVVLGRKFDAPATDSAFTFKWEISFIFEVRLKESRIVLSTRSRNCLRCSILVDDIWIVVMITAVTFPLVVTATFSFWSKKWLDANGTAEELGSIIDAGIRPRNASDAQSHAFDAPHVVP
jgi:hypothetical protein